MKKISILFIALMLFLMSVTFASATIIYVQTWEDNSQSYLTFDAGDEVTFLYESFDYNQIQMVETHINLLFRGNTDEVVQELLHNASNGGTYGSHTIDTTGFVQGHYIIQGTAYNLVNEASYSAFLEFFVYSDIIDTDNNPPYFTDVPDFVFDITQVSSALLLNVADYAVDPDGDELTFNIDTSATNPDVMTCTIQGTQGSVTCNFHSVGTTSLMIIANDGEFPVSRRVNVQVTDTTVNVAPVALFNYNPTNPNPQTIVVFESFSYDIDGTIVLEEWFIEGVKVGEGNLINHVFGAIGNYEVTLIVMDNDGATGQYTTTIAVGDGTELPVADFVYEPQQPLEFEEVTFTSTSTGGAGNIVLEDWFINDVLIQTQNSANTQLIYIFELQGNYEVTLRVTNDAGVVSRTTKTITVSQNMNILKARLNVPSSTTTDVEVLFDGSASYDGTGGNIIAYTWKVLQNGVTLFEETTSTPTTTYVFETKGTYQAQLTVTNNYGLTNSDSKQIVVGRAYGLTGDRDTGDFQILTYAIYGPEFGVISEDVFKVSVHLVNNLKTNAENLRVSFSIPELGISQKSLSFDLGSKKSDVREFFVYGADSIPPGEYDVIIGVAGTDVLRTKYFTVTKE